MKISSLCGKLLAISFTALITSCATISHDGLYCDAISFNDNVRTSYSPEANTTPFLIYTQKSGTNAENYVKLQKFVNEAPQGHNTCGIYAMDLALDRLMQVKSTTLSKDLDTRYYIIYITDGVDNYSLGLAHDNNRGFVKTNTEYAAKVQAKIRSVSNYNSKKKNQFDIFPVIFIGEDLKKSYGGLVGEELTEEINKDMEWVRGSSRGIEDSQKPPIMQVSNFKDASERFAEEFMFSNFSFVVNSGYRGEQIRMTFVDKDSVETQLIGTLDRKGKKWILRDVTTTNGLTSGAWDSKWDHTLVSSNESNTKGIFKFEKPMRDGKTYFIDNGKVKQETKSLDRKVWKYNSEYTAESSKAIDAYLMIVFDTSSSLGKEDFKAEKTAVSDMISTITKGVINFNTDVK